jgi:glycosyltransferase involved in cell wall biosynthesis
LAARNPRIQFLGYVSGTALHALYRQARAVLVPSLCQEIFPLVILEAFQQQTPVIARALGGMSELIHESAGGLLYETNAELLSALELLQENETYRRTLGEQGYRAYLQRWTVETHLQRYFTLINEIVAARRQSSRGTGAMSN